MANVVTINITSGGSPVTSGSYDLRVSPYSSSGIAGSHSGGGNWTFASVDDTASYKLYNTAAGTEVTSITGGGTNTLSFYDTDLGGVVKTTGNQTVAGVKTFSSAPKSSTAASATTELIRWDEAVRLADTQTITGQKYFQTTGGVIPIILSPSTTGYPSNQGHIVTKYYVDTVFNGVIGVVQSSYMVKLIPSRTTEDAYSRPTVEKCNTYLSGLSNISTYRGTMLIEALGQASNAINVDDGSSNWISAGVDIVGFNRPILTRRGYNSSMTFNASISGVKIVDSSAVASRTYVNFTFNDVWFYVNATEMQFTTCKFYNCVFQFAGGEAVTFSNCTGSGLTYNDDADVTFSGTQPANVISTNTANIGF